MNANELVQCLVRSSRYRAIQESVAAVIVMVAFTAFLRQSEPGSPRFYGCLLILIATGFIVGVVCSFALSDRLLRSHPATESDFWREAFHSQARLLRLVPLWYLAPLLPGMILFAAPSNRADLFPFLIVAGIVGTVFAAIAWLNRRAAARIDEQAAQLGY